MVPFSISLFFAFTLLPLPSEARPVTPPMLNARQTPSTRTGGNLVFNIAFSLALLLALLGSFAWLATGRSVTQLAESVNRMYAALIAVTERLSEFRVSSLIEKAATTILDATDADTADTFRRGASYPMATVAWGRLQNGSFGRLGGARGGNAPALAPPM